jgi:hypothetical protein
MSGEKADDRAICDALEQEMLDRISASRTVFTSSRDVMREPWGGQFRKQKPVLALSEMGEA